MPEKPPRHFRAPSIDVTIRRMKAMIARRVAIMDVRNREGYEAVMREDSAGRGARRQSYPRTSSP